MSKVVSPWSGRERAKMLLFELCWTLFCHWTPKPCNRWRLGWLRRFGAKVYGRPFIHQRTRINIPWHLTLHDRACTGDRTNLYALGPITLEAGALVAQEAYLCTGDHDLAQSGKPLVTRPILVETDAFIGARAFVLPGVTIGKNAIIGAGAIVSKSVAPGTTVVGQPAHPIATTPPPSSPDVHR